MRIEGMINRERRHKLGSRAHVFNSCVHAVSPADLIDIVVAHLEPADVDVDQEDIYCEVEDVVRMESKEN